MRAWCLVLPAVCALAMNPSPLHAQHATHDVTLRVFVDVPNAPGTKVTLQYLDAPDSLKGKTQDLVVPTDFLLHTQPVTLLLERKNGHGSVQLRVEQVGSDLMGQGTGDRVRIAVSDQGVQVRAFPWWLPW
jgi:hypothetical protein